MLTAIAMFAAGALLLTQVREPRRTGRPTTDTPAGDTTAAATA